MSYTSCIHWHRHTERQLIYCICRHSPFSEKDYKQLPWVIIPYAVFDYFYQRNLNAYFDKDDVLLHIENKKDTHVVRHYFSGNSSQFLPKWLGGTQ